ncbi:MAG: hypothetical protein GY757_37090 [bacterium]|nr:hypothetical protein [bacterium]
MKNLILLLLILAIVSLKAYCNEGVGKVNKNAFQANCVSGNCTNGYGTLSFPNGVKYIGDFSKNKLDGHGVVIGPNGVRAFSYWKAGVPTGTGIITTPDNTLIILKYEKNKQGPFESTIIFSDGRKFDGRFYVKQNLYKGRLFYPNGKSEDGIIRNPKKSEKFFPYVFESK